MNSILKFKQFEVTVPTFKDSNYNIVDFGAIGDGIFLNTDAINLAIEECSKNGGGKVIIPAGLWLTGPIFLKSNVNLHTESNANIIFIRDFSKYPLIMTNYEGLENIRCTSPIMGHNLQNIAITGNGIFDGNGDYFRPCKQFKFTERQWNKITSEGGVILPPKKPGEAIWCRTESIAKGYAYYHIENNGKCVDMEFAKTCPDFFRPVLLSFVNCNNVLLDGPTFQNSAAWCLHPRLCTNLTVTNVSVRNPWYSSNGDGIDAESCKNVKITNSTFDVGDDAICLKSGKNKEGRDLGIPCENVIIDNCLVYHGHGGFVAGSEMSGGLKNIKVSNCTFMGTDVGIRFKSCIGRGGIVENIFLENILMKDIPNESIIFSTSYDLQAIDANCATIEDIPEFKNIFMNNIKCIGAGTGISISGLSEMPINNVFFEDVLIKSQKGIRCSKGKNINFKNVEIISENNDDIKFSVNNDSLVITEFDTEF